MRKKNSNKGILILDEGWCEQKEKVVKQTYRQDPITHFAYERCCQECDETCTYDCEYKRNQV